MIELLRHRQTKEAATDMFSLQPPRHISTLPRAGLLFGKKTPTPISREAILRRIAEIDQKFKQTDSWLHSILAKDARERELLVAEANRRFDAGFKHEWR